MPKIQVNHINLYYEAVGQGEPLVLIGGFSVDHTIWYPILSLLKQHFQVIIFDNRGAGQSDVPDGPYTIEKMADDTAALCQALNIERAHFIGNSMGGNILQALVYRHENLVKSAIISNSACVIHTCFKFYIEAQLELIKLNVPPAVLARLVVGWVYTYRFLSEPGVLESFVELYENNPHPFSVKGYEGQYVAMNGFDSRAWLREVRVPTLVIGSDLDLIYPESLTKEIAEKIPNAQYYSFEQCGHIPHIEYPEQFAKLVTEFISKNN